MWVESWGWRYFWYSLTNAELHEHMSVQHFLPTSFTPLTLDPCKVDSFNLDPWTTLIWTPLTVDPCKVDSFNLDPWTTLIWTPLIWTLIGRTLFVHFLGNWECLKE